MEIGISINTGMSRNAGINTDLKIDIHSEKDIDTDTDMTGMSGVALYGAGMVAVSIYFAIKTLYRACRVVGFIVTEKTGNPSAIDGLPVMSLDEFTVQDSLVKTEIKILVAAPENHHGLIVAELEKRGLYHYICIDSRTEAAVMERYYNKTGLFSCLHEYHPGSRTALLTVYMARFHKDTPLKHAGDFPHWLCPIQAGAALTDVCIAEVRDNTGDNISEKNVNYSELSVLYWIWKNAADGDSVWNSGSDYIGLFHYRRILDITDEDLCRIEGNDIDLVLPYPTVHYPSADAHHRRYVKDCDWEAMISALKEMAPEYAESFLPIFSQPYFYNYNIFIAKRQVFQDFCSWLFPILERTEELSSPRGWERSDRYIGYLGENLTTLYVMYHKQDLKIVHTGRLMLV